MRIAKSLRAARPSVGSVAVRSARKSVLTLLVLLASTVACASGPRWSAGKTYFQSPDGRPILWNTTQPLYFTDPGDLSASVNHAAADQLVAAAAATWNVSISSIVLAQGGSLNEHVSSANVYLGPSGPVFPADVQASNGAAKPIAIIYDADGSVTDTLLGGGASDPGNCLQSAVTESVDGISTGAQITHALIVLNGRCTGAAPELQLEMQYKLGRAFGRVLGLGWAQANDNVWTGLPLATYQQALHWPLMHPVDILCGPYAYQCTVQPFTLKTDDLASIASLYPVTNPGNGKTATYAQATYIFGSVSFSNGQGMQGVNVISRTRHQQTNFTDTWDGVSSVTGYQFQQVGGNPVTPKGNTLAASFGSPNVDSGHFNLGWIPAPSSDVWDDITLYTQTINPLYTGQYAVGPYQVAQVIPSGPQMSVEDNFIGPFNYGYLTMTATNGAGPCSTSGDGAENAPAPVASTGLWSSTLCGYGHTAWSSLPVKAGRTLAMEVTALDDNGYATTGKLQPVMGLWNASDPLGSAPTLGSQTDSLNTTTLGMTSLLFASGTTARQLRIGLGDVRGDGRPDYQYNARILYADAVAPALLPANGGQVTISGMGFRQGNAVTVNGVSATVTSWSASSIVAVAPALAAAGPMDVTVTDLSTGSQTTMSGALAYSGVAFPDALTIISSPGNGASVGSPASPNFKVLATLPDGVTPAIGVSVTVTAVNATLGACAGASTCVLTSDTTGQVTTSVTPLAAGTVTLTASLGAATVTTTFLAASIPTDALSIFSLPSGTVYTGLPAAAPFGVQVMLPDGVTPAAAMPVAVSAVNAKLGGCVGLDTCTLTTDAAGKISTTVTPLAAGTVSLLATANGGMVSASFGAVALPPDVLHVVSVPADGSYAGRQTAVPFSVQVFLGDGATPAAGVSVLVTAARATLGACSGASSCLLTANSSGIVSSPVTPAGPGTVSLSATAGGVTVSAFFNAAALPPDTLQVMSAPASGSYADRAATTPFAVQVLLGETGAVAAGLSVTVTASNGTLGTCGGAVCVMTADASGRISTPVTPASPGGVTLTASAGGGTATATFNAVALPPDTLQAVSVPADGSYVGRASAVPFTVQVLLGDTGGPAAGATVTVRVSNGTLGGGGSSCLLTADATGSISVTVTPLTPGIVALTALAGGGTVSASFHAVAAPPDMLRVLSVPADGSYAGQVATNLFMVQVTHGDTGAPVVNATVVMSAANATMTYCGGRSTCWLQTDSNGKVWTPVTPTGPGLVVLTSTEGGGTVSATFNAATAAVDRLRIVAQPSGNVYAGLPAASPFTVQVTLPDGVTLAAGAAVTVTAANANLAACNGAPTCVLAADATGTVSTGVTPLTLGLATLTASVGGGKVSTSFSALTLPSDSLRVVSAPAGTVYVGEVAGSRFGVQVMLGDGLTPAAGAAVTLTSGTASLGSCRGAPCVLTADASGMISTTVTPNLAGGVTLTATAGGGSVSAAFTAVVRPPDTLHVLSAPSNGSYVGQVAGNPFSVQVVLGDGTSAPAAGVAVTLTASGASFGVCGGPVCIVTTNGSGIVTSTVIPAATGPVLLGASGGGGGTASATFNAIPVPPDVLQVFSTPPDGSYVGASAALPLAVQVFLADGVTPAAGVTVTLTAAGGILGACGAATCSLTADGQGRVQATVTPQAAGMVTLSASAGGGTVSSSFVAVAPPGGLQVLSAPSGTVYVGFAAGTRFTVQVMLSDGVTPAAGATVSLAATGATFGACAGATCTLTADAFGQVSSDVTPTAAGLVTLRASAGGGTVSAEFTAADPIRDITLARTVEYVAPDVPVAWAPSASVFDNSAPATGVTVGWTVDQPSGFAFAASATVTDAQGNTSNPSVIGPLGVGATASGEACPWPSVCAPFSAVAVDPARWRLVAISGGTQDVAVAGTLDPVVVRVVDDQGHWIAGASVNLRQVVAGWVDCPPEGRCPIAPVLATSSDTLVSDSDGLVSATPLEVPGTRERTRMVLAAGPNGYLSLSLAKSQ